MRNYTEAFLFIEGFLSFFSDKLDTGTAAGGKLSLHVLGKHIDDPAANAASLVYGMYDDISDNVV